MAIVKPYRGIVPVFGEGVFLADNVCVIGDVVLGDRVNVWYGSVIRGDVGKVRIGRDTNVQDLSCIHMTGGLSETIIGDEVSIGHAVVIHGAIIEDGALIGMGSVVMDNARIGEGAVVGAGSLVTSNTVIPAGMLAHGRPARVVRPATEVEAAQGRKTAHKYVGLADEQR